MVLFPLLRMHQRGETGSLVAPVSFPGDEIAIEDSLYLMMLHCGDCGTHWYTSALCPGYSISMPVIDDSS